MQYVPLLPVLLLNGAAGIGTGWSTLVPRCHPVQVLDNVVASLEGRPMAPLLPWSPNPNLNPNPNPNSNPAPNPEP